MNQGSPSLFTGFVTPGPSSTAAISCLVARQLCSEQKTCNQILEVIPKTCGLELGKWRQTIKIISNYFSKYYGYPDFNPKLMLFLTFQLLVLLLPYQNAKLLYEHSEVLIIFHQLAFVKNPALNQSVINCAILYLIIHVKLLIESVRDFD